MNSIRRAGLATLVALAIFLTASAASAIEYDDVIGLTRQGVSDRTIVELIVKDGRAFEMNDVEIQRLADADVSQVVIDAMLDPVAGQDWLDGKTTSRYDEDGIPIGGSSSGSGGYSTSLDRAYQNGYDDGRSTALVYSFGYYYGPLARYYYCDPFYYPFWSSGYSSAYWPSYYAFSYRPSYDWYYAYPYNYYNYNSYYCYTYYDPGYYRHQGYAVAPGYGRTVWDNGPRWRDGGLSPGGTFDGRKDGVRSRILAGTFIDSERGVGRPAAPPILRPAPVARDVRAGGDTGRILGDRTSVRRDLVSGTRDGSGRGMREVVPATPGVERSAAPARRPAFGGMGDRLRVSETQPGAERGRVASEGRTVRERSARDIVRVPARRDDSNRDPGAQADVPRRPLQPERRPERAPEVRREGDSGRAPSVRPEPAPDAPDAPARGEAPSPRPAPADRGGEDRGARGEGRNR
ncbi:MAG: hypothetical protein ABI960_05525 [Candidatus Eisenbacteria bacterium]